MVYSNNMKSRKYLTLLGNKAFRQFRKFSIIFKESNFLIKLRHTR